jgi:low temperature requirement protein LtrA
MKNVIPHKRVEFTELFFDLVFVFAISKTTALIHHLHHGIVSLESFGAFLVSLLVLVNTWMIETVYTNRYGRNSYFNIITMFINMALLLLVSNMVVADWQPYFNYFCGVIGTLSLVLFIQYLVQYFDERSGQKDRVVIRGFLNVTGFRALLIYIAMLFPLNIGYPIYMVGIIGSFIMPLFFQGHMDLVPVNFPHLLERISLLVIITFGEMIMGLAPFFTPETFSYESIAFAIITCCLFLLYFGEFDHAIDESKGGRGIFLIYSHYPIFIGLLMITVSMTFLSEDHANAYFTIGFLYTGLLLFIGSIFANGRQNKDTMQYGRRYLGTQWILFGASLVISLLFAHYALVTITSVMIMIFLMETNFMWTYSKYMAHH